MGCFTFLLGLFAAAVFLASLGLHVASYVPGAPVSLEWGGWLHIAVLVMVFVMTAHGAVLSRAVRRRIRDGVAREQWVEAQIPRWLRPVGVALFVYVFLGGVAFAVREDGQPRVVNGKFALTSHGRVVREVTEPEFHAAQRLEVRGASSAWMLFSAIPTAYFLVVYPRARRALAAPA